MLFPPGGRRHALRLNWLRTHTGAGISVAGLTVVLQFQYGYWCAAACRGLLFLPLIG